MRSIGAMALIAAALALGLASPAAAGGSRVARVIDGDTIVLSNGQHVRLVQIDTPETHGTRECYGAQAASALTKLLPRGTKVRLARDPRLDDRDRYGRLLRYVFRGKTNLNLRLVARGEATVWFFQGDRGRYAKKLLAAEKRAWAHRIGLWKACPATRVDPLRAATTGAAGDATARVQTRAAGKGCQISYTPCLQVVDDLDCAQIADSLKPIHVTGADPYRLDADGDGIGCERP